MDQRHDVGVNVVVDPVDPLNDPYIFQFQQAGTICAYAPEGGFMIRLHAAQGEWGPVPRERLKFDPPPPPPDRSTWRTGDWH